MRRILSRSGFLLLFAAATLALHAPPGAAHSPSPAGTGDRGPAGGIRGEVVGDDGQPLPGVTVRAYRAPNLARVTRAQRTDSAGRYEMEWSVDGPLLIRFDLNCHVPGVLRNLSAGRDHRVSIVLGMSCAEISDASLLEVGRTLSAFETVASIDTRAENRQSIYDAYGYDALLRSIEQRVGTFRAGEQMLDRDADRLLSRVDAVRDVYQEQ